MSAPGDAPKPIGEARIVTPASIERGRPSGPTNYGRKAALYAAGTPDNLTPSGRRMTRCRLIELLDAPAVRLPGGQILWREARVEYRGHEARAWVRLFAERETR